MEANSLDWYRSAQEYWLSVLRHRIQRPVSSPPPPVNHDSREFLFYESVQMVHGGAAAPPTNFEARHHQLCALPHQILVVLSDFLTLKW